MLMQLIAVRKATTASRKGILGPGLIEPRMIAQSKTNSRSEPSYWVALERSIRSAYRRVESRFGFILQAVKEQILSCFPREPAVEESRGEEPYFWVELYNAALLESDPRQAPRRLQCALRAIAQRRGCLERSMDAGEWNLLQYAEMALSHMAGTTTLVSRPGPSPRLSAPREKNAA